MGWNYGSQGFQDFYKNGNYSGSSFGNDFLYGLNPLNWFKGSSFNENAPSVQQARKDYNEYKMKQFRELFTSGASTEDMITWLADNPDFDIDEGIINAMLTSAQNREALQQNNYEINLQKMKDAGINPLVGIGNVSNLASIPYTDVSVDSSNATNDVNGSGNEALSLIKNLLMILLVLRRL